MDEKTLARFWSKVDIRGPEECWEWRARAVTDFGYGAFRLTVPRKTVGAHRVAYEATKGPIAGACVLHTCDNPKCCNPSHLFLGTRADNNADMCRKGRYVGFKNSPRVGEENNKARLTAAQVELIRSELAQGVTGVDIGRRFGIAKATVSQIRRRKTWKHVP